MPFVRQPKEGCGAASLSMVMLYWQHQLGVHPAADSDVTQIQKQLYEPRLHGIPAEAMQLYLRQHGYNAFTLRGTWKDLQRQLQKGRPLIAALKPQGQSELHYVVIDGVDSEKGLVSMNDPAERKLLTQERAAFEKHWRATQNWLLLAVPSASPRPVVSQ